MRQRPSPVLPALALAGLLAACRPAAEAPPDAPRPTPAPAPATAADADADAAPEPARPQGQVPRRFRCTGNEPFWSLALDVHGGVLATPDGETLLVGELAATGTGAWTFRGSPEDEPQAFTGAVLSPAQCFDTMADGPAMPFSAAVSFADGSEGSGCCRAEFGLDLERAPAFDPDARGEDDWTRRLPDLGTAVLRCAFDGGVATAGVSKAWPMNHGKAMVRLVDSDDARFDCLVDLGSGDIETVRPVAPGDRAPGEDQPRWLPPGDSPPVLGCGRVERVLAGGDLVTGYLHYTEGC